MLRDEREDKRRSTTDGREISCKYGMERRGKIVETAKKGVHYDFRFLCARRVSRSQRADQ